MNDQREAAAAKYDGIVPKLESEPCAFKRQCFRDGWDTAITAIGEREVTVAEATDDRYALDAEKPKPVEIIFLYVGIGILMMLVKILAGGWSNLVLIFPIGLFFGAILYLRIIK